MCFPLRCPANALKFCGKTEAPLSRFLRTMMIATIIVGGEGGGEMRLFRYGWRYRGPGRGPKKLGGVAVAAAGTLLILKVLPIWIWPFGVGLWLLWAGLGPLVIGGALIWVGWRMLSAL